MRTNVFGSLSQVWLQDFGNFEDSKGPGNC